MLLIDTHVHIYKEHSLPRLLQSALSNLRSISRTLNGPEALYGICLTERKDESYFRQLLESDALLRESPFKVGHRDELSIGLLSNEGEVLWVFNGYQIISREKTEVLSLFSKKRLEEKLSARELIARTILEGGIPVLPWSPGKWLGKRGTIVRELVQDPGFDYLYVGDISMRARTLPMPFQFDLAVQNGRKVLAGTDPLPLSRDAELVGSYATLLRGDYKVDAPLEGLLKILKSKEPRIELVGKRCGIPGASIRYLSNLFSKF